MFTVALITEAKTWKKPNHPSSEEWMKKIWNMSTMKYYSGIKTQK